MYARSGTQFAQFNTVFQLLAEARSKPNLLTAADKMLLMPDFINFMLAGQKKAEFTIASTTGLVDPRVRDWDRKLIREFGFPEKIFPGIVEPGTILGTLLPSIAESVGLNPGIPVRRGGRCRYYRPSTRFLLPVPLVPKSRQASAKLGLLSKMLSLGFARQDHSDVKYRSEIPTWLRRYRRRV